MESSERGPRADGLVQVAIERTSTSDQVADALRQAILRGELQPGTPLREAAVATAMGVSRNTVREAVKLLTRERLVTHQAHRGAEVTRLTEADVADIYNVRRILETQAVRAVAEADAAALERLIEELDDCLQNLRDAVDADDYGAMAEADVAFHQGIVHFLGSSRIDAFFEGIQAELQLSISMIDRTYEDPTALNDEHQELRDLIASGRVLECQERLVMHLDEADVVVRGIVRGQGVEGGGQA